MFTKLQEKQILDRGVSIETLNLQLTNFKKGFPYLKILSAATPAKGIKVLNESQQEEFTNKANSYSGTLCKFVPASGAATRMFKDLFEAASLLSSGGTLKEGSPAEKFVKNITLFPFFDAKSILNLTLYSNALNYGSLPKGLIQFHKYKDENRTPFEEHLVEGALYAKDVKGVVNMVVTVSKEHQQGFEQLLSDGREKYEKRYNCRYNVVFTNQLPSTDIVAVDMENNAFVKDDGTLLFRPGGHGALLQNLNDIDSNIIIIKNIDNVVKESLIEQTIKWKKILIGKVVALEQKAFAFLNKLDELGNNIPDSLLAEIKDFLAEEFCVELPKLQGVELIDTLKAKLNRPIRVCGMVKNEGEPGGGPYIVEDEDGASSLQILEAAQLNTSNSQVASIVKGATHFNPVDLVCSVKNYKGEKFDLSKYTDPKTGFISEKSYQGRALKAQELPGLWNGAMSNWNTQFVETPLITFNPVKTVLDLLRPQHCNEL